MSWQRYLGHSAVGVGLGALIWLIPLHTGAVTLSETIMFFGGIAMATVLAAMELRSNVGKTIQ